MALVQEKEPKKIAEVISPQFSDIPYDDLVKIIERYKNADSWLDTPYIEKDLFENLENIMIKSNQIDDFVPYNSLINNAYTN